MKQAQEHIQAQLWDLFKENAYFCVTNPALLFNA